MAGLPEGFVIDKGGPPQGFVIDEQPSRVGEDVKQLGAGAAEGFIESPDQLGHLVAATPGMGPLYGLGAKAGATLLNKGIDAITDTTSDQPATYAGAAKRLLGKYSPDQLVAPAKDFEQRAARTTGSFLGNPLTYTGPGGFLSKLGTAVTSALGSEVAGTLAEDAFGKDSPAGPLARTFGAMITPAAMSAGRRMLSPPELSAENAATRERLAREGIELSAGQATQNEALKYKEAESGSPAQRLNERQSRQLTQAALRRIDETGDDVHEATARARPIIGQEIEDAAANMRVRANPEFTANLTTRLDRDLLAEGYAPESEVSRRVHAMAADVLGAFDFVPRGRGVKPGPDHMEMSGEAFHERIRHSSVIARAIEEGGTVGYYASRIRNALFDAAERTANRRGTRDDTGDRAAFERLQDARRKWRNLLALEDVSASAGDVAASGRLTPAMVRRLAVWRDKTDYSRNLSDFAGLARDANRLMQPLPQSGTNPRWQAQFVPRAIGAGIGSMLGAPALHVGSGLGAAIGATIGPMVQGRILMSPWAQRYYGSGAFAPRSPYEHLMRSGRAGAATLPGFAEGGTVDDDAGPVDEAGDNPFERAAARTRRSVFAPGRARPTMPEGIPPTLAGTAASAADPLRIPSALTGLYDPELRDQWRDLYERDPAGNFFGTMATLRPAAEGLNLAAKPIFSAIRNAPKYAIAALGSLGLLNSAGEAGYESDRPASSFDVPLPDPDPTLVAKRNAVQSQIDAADAAFQKRANTKGIYPTVRARQNDLDLHTRNMDALRGDLRTANDEIRAEQQARQAGKQTEAKALYDIEQAKLRAERPLVEQYPALNAAPYLGGAAAGWSSYIPRSRAVGLFNQFAERANEVAKKAERALEKAPNAPKTRQLVAQAKEYADELPDMQKMINRGFWGGLGHEVGPAFAGGLLAGELSLAPYQVDWATQPEQSRAGQEARHRLLTGEGWLKTASSGMAGLTGSALGSIVPTRVRPSWIDAARLRAVTSNPFATAAPVSGPRALAVPVPPAMTGKSAYRLRNPYAGQAAE